MAALVLQPSIAVHRNIGIATLSVALFSKDWVGTLGFLNLLVHVYFAWKVFPQQGPSISFFCLPLEQLDFSKCLLWKSQVKGPGHSSKHSSRVEIGLECMTVSI